MFVIVFDWFEIVVVFVLDLFEFSVVIFIIVFLGFVGHVIRSLLGCWVKRQGKTVVDVEIVEFVGVDGVVEKNVIVDDGVGWGFVRRVIFGVVDGVVWTPFDDETAVLNEGLTLVVGNRFDARDGGLGDGEFGPPVTRKASAGGERHKKIIAVCVSCRGEGDGAGTARFYGVAGIVVVENLDVTPEF